MQDDACFTKPVNCLKDEKNFADGECEKMYGFGGNTSAPYTFWGLLIFISIVSILSAWQDFIINFLPDDHTAKRYDFKEKLCLPCCKILCFNRVCKLNNLVHPGAESAYYFSITLVLNTLLNGLIQPGTAVGTFNRANMGEDLEVLLSNDYAGAAIWNTSLTTYTILVDTLTFVGIFSPLWLYSMVLLFDDIHKHGKVRRKCSYIFVLVYIYGVLILVSAVLTDLNFSFSMLFFCVSIDLSDFRIRVPSINVIPAVFAIFHGVFRLCKTCATLVLALKDPKTPYVVHPTKVASVIEMEEKPAKSVDEAALSVAEGYVEDKAKEMTIEVVKKSEMELRKNEEPCNDSDATTSIHG